MFVNQSINQIIVKQEKKKKRKKVVLRKYNWVKFPVLFFTTGQRQK